MPQKMNTKTIVISDLDGTLLDSLTYSFEKALHAVGLLKDRGVPLVLCSSKTRSEILLYREKLGNTDPFISENGGGVFIPEGYFTFGIKGNIAGRYTAVTLGKQYDVIRDIFCDVRARTGAAVRGFGDMSVPEVASLTGLPSTEAALALKREFDEPFIFENGECLDDFLQALETRGLNWTKGSFYHALGNNDKGKAVAVLKGFFEKTFGAVRVIGIGDSLNDLPMLLAADVPVLVQKQDGSYEKDVDFPGLIKAEGRGPEGWRFALDTIFKGCA